MNMEVAAQSVLFILRRSEDKTAENHSESQDKTKEESKPSESMLPQPFPENFVSKISDFNVFLTGSWKLEKSTHHS